MVSVKAPPGPPRASTPMMKVPLEEGASVPLVTGQIVLSASPPSRQPGPGLWQLVRT